jgi:hypothetical protein
MFEVGYFETSETIHPTTHRYIQEDRNPLINISSVIFFPVAQEPKWGLGSPIVEVYTSHTIRHKHPVGPPVPVVAEAANFTIQQTQQKNIHGLSGIRTLDPQQPSGLRMANRISSVISFEIIASCLQ